MRIRDLDQFIKDASTLMGYVLGKPSYTLSVRHTGYYYKCNYCKAAASVEKYTDLTLAESMVQHKPECIIHVARRINSNILLP